MDVPCTIHVCGLGVVNNKAHYGWRLTNINVYMSWAFIPLDSLSNHKHFNKKKMDMHTINFNLSKKNDKISNDTSGICIKWMSVSFMCCSWKNGLWSVIFSSGVKSNIVSTTNCFSQGTRGKTFLTGGHWIVRENWCTKLEIFRMSAQNTLSI